MASTATLLMDGLGGYAGPANLYQLDPPLLGHDHVVVWTQEIGTPEAVIVAAYETGAAKVMNRLPGSYVAAEVSHAGALFLAGYEVVIPDPEPEPEPEPEGGA